MDIYTYLAHTFRYMRTFLYPPDHKSETLKPLPWCLKSRSLATRAKERDAEKSEVEGPQGEVTAFSDSGLV